MRPRHVSLLGNLVKAMMVMNWMNLCQTAGNHYKYDSSTSTIRDVSFNLTTSYKSKISVRYIVGIGATSPIGLTCRYLPLAEAISSAPNTSHIACHLRIPTGYEPGVPRQEGVCNV